MKQLHERPEFGEPVEVVGKRSRTPLLLFDSEDEDEEEMKLVESSVEEETLMHVMKLLEEEINRPANASDSDSLSVTINGYEESCGPSFSDSSSTVMASLDMGGVHNIPYFMGSSNGLTPFPNSALDLPAMAEVEEDLLWPEIGEVSVSNIAEEEINKGYGFVQESDGEWLARVLSEAPFEFLE